MNPKLPLLVIALLMSFARADDLPAEAELLQHIKEREVAIIEAKYQAALARLYEKKMESGRFKAAAAVKSLIVKTEPCLIGTRWEGRYGTRFKGVFTLGSLGKVDAPRRYRGVTWKRPKKPEITHFTLTFPGGKMVDAHNYEGADKSKSPDKGWNFRRLDGGRL